MKASTLIWFLLGGGLAYFVWKKFFGGSSGVASGNAVPNYGSPLSKPDTAAHAAAKGGAAAQAASTPWAQILGAISNIAKGAGAIFGGGGSGSGGSASGKISDLFGGGSKSPSSADTSKEAGKNAGVSGSGSLGGSSDEYVNVTYNEDGITWDGWHTDESFNPFSDDFNAAVALEQEAPGNNGVAVISSPGRDATYGAPWNTDPASTSTMPGQNVYDFGSYTPPQIFTPPPILQTDYGQSNANYSISLNGDTATQASFAETFGSYGGFGVSGAYDFDPGDTGFEGYA